jgi:O-antigen/teichoic acid export membrane protein
VRLPAFFEALRDAPAAKLHVGAGTAFTVVVRGATYVMVAITGIVVARALGAHDRGLYSLVTTIAIMFAALTELGISRAGIYLVGRKRCTLQDIISNNAAWVLPLATAWVALCLVMGVIRPGIFPPDVTFIHYVVFALGGVFLLVIAFAEDVLLASGSVLSYNAIEFFEPFVRVALILGGVILLGIGMTGVLIGWVAAIIFAGLLALYFVAQRGALTPLLRPKLLKAQLSFGLRGYLGYVLQEVNHRLDVFLVIAFVGSEALGHYAVAFGMAELLWQIPFALGVVLFPKASALDNDENAQTAATTCRRALAVTLMGTLFVLATGRFLISFLYGSEFEDGTWALYILAPSAMFYTVHKVLGSALAGRGMPEVGLYSGAASLPVTIGLDVLLIPSMGIEGAALASICAYAVNASVVLLFFLRVTGRSIGDILLINREDIAASLATARGLLARSEAQEA